MTIRHLWRNAKSLFIRTAVRILQTWSQTLKAWESVASDDPGPTLLEFWRDRENSYNNPPEQWLQLIQELAPSLLQEDGTPRFLGWSADQGLQSSVPLEISEDCLDDIHPEDLADYPKKLAWQETFEDSDDTGTPLDPLDNRVQGSTGRYASSREPAAMPASQSLLQRREPTTVSRHVPGAIHSQPQKGWGRRILHALRKSSTHWFRGAHQQARTDEGAIAAENFVPDSPPVTAVADTAIPKQSPPLPAAGYKKRQERWAKPSPHPQPHRSAMPSKPNSPWRRVTNALRSFQSALAPRRQPPAIANEPGPPQPQAVSRSVERTPPASPPEAGVSPLTTTGFSHSPPVSVNHSPPQDETTAQKRAPQPSQRPSTPRPRDGTVEPANLPQSSSQPLPSSTERILRKQALKPVRLQPIFKDKRQRGLAHQPQMFNEDELTPQNLTAETNRMAEGRPNQVDDSDAIPSSGSMFQPTPRSQSRSRSLAAHPSLTHHRQPRSHSTPPWPQAWGSGQHSVPPQWSRISSAASWGGVSHQPTPLQGGVTYPTPTPEHPWPELPDAPEFRSFASQAKQKNDHQGWGASTASGADSASQHPWPELPEVSIDDSADELMAYLRSPDYLARLEREQRGDL